jgi:histidinol-phosphatase
VGGKVWDYTALSLIVEEAGGRFSGDRGQLHPVTGTAIFSCGDAPHAAARAVLAGDASQEPQEEGSRAARFSR